MTTARGNRPGFALRHPAQYVVAAFVVASLLGAVLLSIPAATEGAGGARPVTALFTAASAVCVTGLAVVDTGAYWSTFGEWVILGLMQVGGLGIMTLTSLVVLIVGRGLRLRQRLLAVAETGSVELGEIRHILLGVAKLSFAVEAFATAALTLRFWFEHDEPLARAAYLGLFHTVSAFNNAGFGLYPDSMVSLNRDPFVLLILALTIVIGGLGFPVWIQIARHARRPRRWSLHAKLTVTVSAALILAGWVALAVSEWTNAATLGPMSAPDALVNALFHSVVPRSAGFNSVDVASLREPSLLVTEILMFIGGGSASTAGGIKVTTFAVLGAVMWAELRGDPDVVVFERRIPDRAVRHALTVALLAIGVVMGATMALLATSDLPRAALFFETVSALGAVGMTMNLTPLLPEASQIIVVVLMVLGRVGPPTLFAALVLRDRRRLYRNAEERPIIG